MLNTMISETLQPIKKAAAFTRARVVASTRMNTTIVVGDRLAKRPSSNMVTTRLMGATHFRSPSLVGSRQISDRSQAGHTSRGRGGRSDALTLRTFRSRSGRAGQQRDPHKGD